MYLHFAVELLERFLKLVWGMIEYDWNITGGTEEKNLRHSIQGNDQI